MDADWSVEAGADDPVIVVPWTAPDGSLCFIDLRRDPSGVQQIREAQQHPAMCRALLAANAPTLPFFTAKCDVWPLSAEEIETIAQELDLESVPAYGFGSYIDLLLKGQYGYAAYEQFARAAARAVAEIVDHPEAYVEFVIRPAIVEGAQGFAVTVYVFALSTAEPETAWAAALETIFQPGAGASLAQVADTIGRAGE